jgi:ectoine hydroxylase-related dioxygenase (phytanoyl-CoA dioxygenase family)
MQGDHLAHYHEHGYAVVRGVFDRHEVAELAEAFDRLHDRALSYGASFRHQNVLFRLGDDANLGRIVRMVQWPSYVDPVLARYRTDPRMLAIVAPLLGKDLKQIINQMHWKPPGARAVEWGYHQDIRFRRPREAYRQPATSYIQTGIAVDRHDEQSGAMTVVPGSHRLGELSAVGGRVMDRALNDRDLGALGLDPANVVHLTLEPGDVAFWHLHTIHGSGPNHAPVDRRFYLNGYVIAENCDRGEWAFCKGEPCALGEPVLVHYEQLYERPEPHFLDDA